MHSSPVKRRSTSASPGAGTAQRQSEYWRRAPGGRRPPDHPAVRALFEPRAEDLAELVPDAASASVLDVGCGNGFLTYYLASCFGRVVGVDNSPAMLGANPCEHRVCATAQALPFDDLSFDLVVASHLLHHLEEDDRREGVREMARIARTALILYEPNRNNPLMFLFGLLKPEERFSLAFSPGHLRSLAAESGFPRAKIRVEGLTVPNKAPAFYAPIGRALDNTLLQRCGFYLRAIATRSADYQESRPTP